MSDAHQALATLARIRSLLRYDREVGKLFWRMHHGRPASGSEAGYVRPDGYRAVEIDGKSHRVHRLVWLIETGEWPSPLDHANGDQSDNRFTNLRLATPTQNNANMRRRSDNSTGFKGVSINNGRFRAAVRVRGQRMHLGYFNTAEQAHAAYMEAAVTHFGEFARAS